MNRPLSKNGGKSVTLAPATGAQPETPATEGARTSRVPVRRSTGRRLSKRDREAFIEALSNGWTARDAAKLTGRHHSTFYALRQEDEEFAEAWATAWEAGTQALEQEAFRRGVEGYDETTFDGDGNVMRRVRRYDSALLQRLLIGRRPDVYGNAPHVQVTTTTNVGEIRHKRGYTVADLVRYSLENDGPKKAAELSMRLGIEPETVLAVLAEPKALPAAGETGAGS